MINDEPLDSAVGCAKALLSIASGLALLGWTYGTLMSLGWSGFPKTLLEAFLLVFPFIYLSSAIYCCWHNIPRRALVITAITLNLPVVAIGIYAAIASRTFSLAIFFCLLFVLLWIFLIAARYYANGS